MYIRILENILCFHDVVEGVHSNSLRFVVLICIDLIDLVRKLCVNYMYVCEHTPAKIYYRAIFRTQTLAEAVVALSFSPCNGAFCVCRE